MEVTRSIPTFSKGCLWRDPKNKDKKGGKDGEKKTVWKTTPAA